MDLKFTLCVYADHRLDVGRLVPLAPGRTSWREGDAMKGHYYDVEYGGGEFLVSLRDFLHRFETTADVLKGAGATLAVWCLLNDAASFTGLVVDAETMNFMGRRSIDFYISIYGSAPDHSD
jgi:hypothetical protein